jgi:glucose/arabinose dehydrogenase
VKKYILIFYALLLSINVLSNTSDTEYELIVENLNNPWSFVFLNENSILINEKKGELIHFENGRKKIITGLPKIVDQGQGGLLDIELHPNYKSNGWIYITYDCFSKRGK